MPDWTPEIAIDEERAGRLVAQQFPELSLRALRLLEGWDTKGPLDVVPP